jgi:mannosyl-oligosaccharide alpha-1,3-glucosidase
MLERILLLLLLVTPGLMVKQETFKTCAQSGFCVRQRAFAELRSTFKDPIWSITNDIQKSAHSFTAQVKCDQFPEAKFRGEWYLFDDSLRFKLVEVDGLFGRYEFPFSIETLPPGVKLFNVKSSDKTVEVDFGDHLVVITKSPFSFKVFGGKSRVPAMDFNSRDFLYYEPYHTNQTTPPFALLPENVDNGKEKSKEVKTIEDLKRKVVEGLSTESFGGKTDSKPKGNYII